MKLNKFYVWKDDPQSIIFFKDGINNWGFTTTGVWMTDWGYDISHWREATQEEIDKYWKPQIQKEIEKRYKKGDTIESAHKNSDKKYTFNEEKTINCLDDGCVYTKILPDTAIMYEGRWAEIIESEDYSKESILCEYMEFVEEEGKWSYGIPGRIYKHIKTTEDKDIKVQCNLKCGTFKPGSMLFFSNACWKPSTKEAYEAQVKPTLKYKLGNIFKIGEYQVKVQKDKGYFLNIISNIFSNKNVFTQFGLKAKDLPDYDITNYGDFPEYPTLEGLNKVIEFLLKQKLHKEPEKKPYNALYVTIGCEKDYSIVYFTGENSGYGFNSNGKWFNNNNWKPLNEEDWKPATSKDIEKWKEFLLKEANKRGFVKGALVTCLHDWHKGNTTNKPLTDGICRLNEEILTLFSENGLCYFIYQKGKWAEVLEESKINKSKVDINIQKEKVEDMLSPICYPIVPSKCFKTNHTEFISLKRKKEKVSLIYNFFIMNNYFIKGIIARLKGDDDTAKAIKIAKKCTTAFEHKLTTVKSDILNTENDLDDAKEQLNNSLFITEFPRDNGTYVNGIFKAQEKVDILINEIEDLKTEEAYLTDLLIKLKSDAIEEIVNKQ